MEIDQIRLIFNRAVDHSFQRKKWFFAFALLALCGLVYGFFLSLAVNVGAWMRLSLIFIPFFISAGILLSGAIFLIRLYHDEIKNKKCSMRATLQKSWDLLIGASYFAIPIILCYLLLWLTLGIVVLFQQLPVVGSFFGALLAFAPFLINLGSLLLCLLSVALLFFVAPALALKGLDGVAVIKAVAERLKKDLFSNLLLAAVSLFPLAAVVALLLFAGRMSGSFCMAGNDEQSLFFTVRWLMTMIPFAALLAPALIFFFNFAAEAHVLLVKGGKGRES